MWPWGEIERASSLDGRRRGEEFRDVSTNQFGTRVQQHSAAYDREPAETAKVFDYVEQNPGKNIQIVRDIPQSAVTP
jgi:hypothetical protein